MQQWRGLKKKGVKKQNPWQQFFKDLSALIEELQGKNHEVVLSLDANEDILDGGQFTKFVKDIDLVDAYHHLYPHSNPATYLRGYMFLTPRLTPAFCSIGYLPFHTGIFLDHCALYADFDPEILFLGDTSSSIDPATGKLKATNPKRVQNYTEDLLRSVEENNMLQKAIDLQKDHENNMMEIMLAAEKSCCRVKTGYAWLLKLVK
eukprot:3362898-Ditylum_brightwellii.AAC.1